MSARFVDVVQGLLVYDVVAQPFYGVDLTVAEHWSAGDGRWRMVDAQLDETWCARIGFAGNPLALTPSEFVSAGHAWQAWRRGELDAGRCGLSAMGRSGSSWIAHNLLLDLASLNKVEMLLWDLWGAAWEPGTEPSDAQLNLFDAVAGLTVDPDARFPDLRSRYEGDDALRVPDTVLAAGRGRMQTV